MGFRGWECRIRKFGVWGLGVLGFRGLGMREQGLGPGSGSPASVFRILLKGPGDCRIKVLGSGF